MTTPSPRTLSSLAAALGLLVPSPALAGTFDLSVSGSWTPFVDDADLSGGAGTDLPSTLESDSDEITIDLTGADDDADAWRIEIAYDSGPFWNDNLTLEVRRVSDGSGSGSITGGSSYTTLTSSGTVLFTGAGDRAGIQLQLRLSGLSVADIDPDTYLAQITYTVVDT